MYRNSKHTYYVPTKFFPENLGVYEKMWKNTVQPDGLQMVIKYRACLLHGEKLRLQTHTQNM
jgi:hypothetical protein